PPRNPLPRPNPARETAALRRSVARFAIVGIARVVGIAIRRIARAAAGVAESRHTHPVGITPSGAARRDLLHRAPAEECRAEDRGRLIDGLAKELAPCLINLGVVSVISHEAFQLTRRRAPRQSGLLGLRASSRQHCSARNRS